MKKYFLPFVLLIIYSCKDSIVARIDFRNDAKDCYGYDGDLPIVSTNDEYEDRQKDNKTKSAYLVNESIDKAYEFTVKQIESINDSIVKYTILKIKLSPGDEKWLGCTSYRNVIANLDSAIQPKKISTVVLDFTCTGQRVITNFRELEEK